MNSENQLTGDDKPTDSQPSAPPVSHIPIVVIAPVASAPLTRGTEPEINKVVFPSASGEPDIHT